jgi:hypothetical protein
MWVVVLGSHLPYRQSACWGPFDSQAAADRFAAFVTEEIDPAQAIRVTGPASELLTWREDIVPRMLRETSLTNPKDTP